ncbi:hypothetical protein KAR91_46450 [Candidatus Pacearchaeota archaeon]|nr:hypothetical protein [Candidatus Pacearchaeota archaeon]
MSKQDKAESITKREHAAIVICASLSASETTVDSSYDAISQNAVRQADSLFDELEKEQ